MSEMMEEMTLKDSRDHRPYNCCMMDRLLPNQLRASLVQQRRAAYLTQLRETAKITRP